MTLGELVSSLADDPPLTATSGAVDDAAASRTVKAVVYDSRRATPGSVFVALRGQHANGTAFARPAVAKGALAIVAESAPPPDVGVPWIEVTDSRLALARLAARFFGDPSDRLTLVGITGTNGKTTTAYLTSAIFEAAGMPCGLVGTVTYRICGEDREASRTTPEAPDVQQMLREMVECGSRACVMEVSSHALTLRRVDHVRFAAAIFTNLTRDHLDFHGDMVRYFQAKRRLFEMLPPEAIAAVNVDDPHGASLVPMLARPVTYAIDRSADVRPGPLSFSLRGLAFEARTPRGTLHIRSPLVGRPNVYNILAAAATGVALGLPFDAIERGVASVAGVPGRFQIVSRPSDDVTVVVDYAHTDDALKNLLETARPLAPRRLITVFGCGGNRDRTKRPLMGAVAAQLSDVVVVTSDNPRGEDPRAVIDEVMRGITPLLDRASEAERLHARAAVRRVEPLTILDRREAIKRAVSLAEPGDVVLVAGKGHERYQEIGDRVLPFDDVAVARDALDRRAANSRVS
ncbi:MAG: UDP-N-acetylmuramoyl-L-alanyl-D-glutamate--2,6-diaminopimelate ligase [Acidobacteria bacterium]|nr:UDP-N-acetylmuramoyl-L-alanyl-D-glutamate--2,6-diaminopimelate ligase [Acidobacteriota bacterium]